MGEVDSVKEVLEQLGMEVVDMRSGSTNSSQKRVGTSGGRSDSVAHCDGGDVLYTGRHLFVGMSNRTNELGYALLREVFESTVEVVKVPPVIQGKDVLHLKSAGGYYCVFALSLSAQVSSSHLAIIFLITNNNNLYQQYSSTRQ